MRWRLTWNLIFGHFSLHRFLCANASPSHKVPKSKCRDPGESIVLSILMNEYFAAALFRLRHLARCMRRTMEIMLKLLSLFKPTSFLCVCGPNNNKFSTLMYSQLACSLCIVHVFTVLRTKTLKKKFADYYEVERRWGWNAKEIVINYRRHIWHATIDTKSYLLRTQSMRTLHHHIFTFSNEKQ